MQKGESEDSRLFALETFKSLPIIEIRKICENDPE